MGPFVERERGVITRIVAACEGIRNTTEKFEKGGGGSENVKSLQFPLMKSLTATAKSFGELTENITANNFTQNVQPIHVHWNETALAWM